MSEPRCDMSDLLVSQCAHCKGITGKAEQFEYVVERTMVAKFSGVCAACGERIVAGESTIGLASEEGVGWVCEGCFRA